jgi:phosphoglycerol transferase MdoB-like AlkP superfamily enzyme
LQAALIQLALKDPSTRATMVRLPLTVVFGQRIMGLRHHRPIEFLMNNSLPAGVIILVIGLLFLFVPKEAVPILILTLLSIATLAQLAFLIYLLFLSHWHFETQLMRIYLLIVLIVFTVAMYINQDMLSVFSSIVFGTSCLIFSFSIFGKVPSYSHRKDYFMVVWSILESLAVLTAGIYFIVASGYSVDVINSLMGYLAIGVGAFLIVLGLAQVLHEKKTSAKE